MFKNDVFFLFLSSNKHIEEESVMNMLSMDYFIYKFQVDQKKTLE